MGALCSSISQPLGPEDTFSQRGGLPERRDSHSSEILIPGARRPFDLTFTFLEEGGEVEMEAGGGRKCGVWPGEFCFANDVKMHRYTK